MEILIIDDNYANRLLFKGFLRKLGYDGHFVQNGQEALNFLETDKNIKLIFMDIEMPVLNGLETTEIIRKNSELGYQNVAIIAFTIYSVENTYENKGFTDFFAKPYTFERLKEIINKYIP